MDTLKRSIKQEKHLKMLRTDCLPLSIETEHEVQWCSRIEERKVFRA